MKPFLPDSIMSVLGDRDSNMYLKHFIPRINAYFQLMWNQRHVLYFASRFLTFFPSTTQAPQLTEQKHDQFFAELSSTVLQGSDTYGEFASKVVLDKETTRPLTEKILDKVSKWSRKVSST